MFDIGDRITKAAVKTLIPIVHENKEKAGDVIKKIIDDQELHHGEVECGVLFIKNNSGTISVSLAAFNEQNKVVRIIDSKELSDLLIDIIESITSNKK
ncbi:MAG: hypothetical protein M0R02_09210 [Bacteroidales bacterium]|nr:hypothetical protein [Bacteroidales bacterium]NLK82414.1 hypothetical protein [Bacteroidales bacterium]